MLIYVKTGESRAGIEERLEPGEVKERNEYLKRTGNVYKWVRIPQPHRDKD